MFSVMRRTRLTSQIFKGVEYTQVQPRFKFAELGMAYRALLPTVIKKNELYTLALRPRMRYGFYAAASVHPATRSTYRVNRHPPPINPRIGVSPLQCCFARDVYAFSRFAARTRLTALRFRHAGAASPEIRLALQRNERHTRIFHHFSSFFILFFAYFSLPFWADFIFALGHLRMDAAAHARGRTGNLVQAMPKRRMKAFLSGHPRLSHLPCHLRRYDFASATDRDQNRTEISARRKRATIATENIIDMLR